ncbi:MAG: methyl-accepting chemotaxis protein [Caulobacteraceae bacterium]|nr:methyl-accepting chemotaxis protein [Caulobacteraceae bacterium]
MARLRLVVALAGIGLAVAIALGLANLSGAMHEDIAVKTRSVVESAASVAAHYADEAKAGRMSEADAKAAAISALRAMRYNGQEYFWITDLDTRMIMHPFKPKLNGTDVSGLRDPAGKAMFSAMTEVAKAKGAGYVNYQWPKPGHDKPQPKISYVASLPAWGWVIGSGVYVDEINDAVIAAGLKLTGVGLLLLLAVGAGATLLGGTITRPILNLTHRMTGLAQGDKLKAVPYTALRNEIGQMASALEVFREAAIDRDRLEAEAAAQRAAAEAERHKREVADHAAAEIQRRVVADVTGVAARLAKGDLTVRISDSFPADYAALRDNLNAALSQLADAMKVVRDNTNGIQNGADDIAAASDDLARRTEQQAATLEETTAALGELTGAVRRSATGAGQARAAVTVAQEQAQYSGGVADRAVSAMGEIEGSSQQIQQIIGVIDEIAFQTNLLALNAGVEAARAGESGRGFAVVAQEVRALAQRSAEAAKEIKALIGASTQQIGVGVNLVREMGDALQGIVGKVGEIDNLVRGIAALAEEQSLGLGHINEAMLHIDQTTQQNAAMVEQSTAAVHSLKNETGQLARLVGRFEVGGARDSAPTPVFAPARRAG